MEVYPVYENIALDYYAGGCRVFQLLSVPEERGGCGNYHALDDDQCSLDLGYEENFDVGFDRSVAIDLAEKVRQEEGRG